VLLTGPRCDTVRNFTAPHQWNPFFVPLPSNLTANRSWATIGVRAGKHGPASTLGEEIDLAR
jgi:hypothetical protein